MSVFGRENKLSTCSMEEAVALEAKLPPSVSVSASASARRCARGVRVGVRGTEGRRRKETASRWNLVLCLYGRYLSAMISAISTRGGAGRRGWRRMGRWFAGAGAGAGPDYLPSTFPPRNLVESTCPSSPPPPSVLPLFPFPLSPFPCIQRWPFSGDWQMSAYQRRQQ